MDFFTLFTGFRPQKDVNKRKNLWVSPMCIKVLLFYNGMCWNYIKTVFESYFHTFFTLFDGFERLPKRYLKTEIYIVRSPKIQN